MFTFAALALAATALAGPADLLPAPDSETDAGFDVAWETTLVDNVPVLTITPGTIQNVDFWVEVRVGAAGAFTQWSIGPFPQAGPAPVVVPVTIDPAVIAENPYGIEVEVSATVAPIRIDSGRPTTRHRPEAMWLTWPGPGLPPVVLAQSEATVAEPVVGGEDTPTRGTPINLVRPLQPVDWDARANTADHEE